ncbi:MAG: amino acid-binding protein [Gammaproteobacteria bacterium]|nr:amino acid-binding protein [Gammaproteobacteria bacterium]
MQQQWYMLTVVGKDKPGIVAKVTAALFDTGCNLGETSMIRLGGNFTMMLMVQYDENDAAALENIITPVVNELLLHCHVDAIDGRLHEHRESNVRISVYGADRTGIVSQVTNALAQAGLNIFDLTSDVAGTVDNPVYVMQIEGYASQGADALRCALDNVTEQDAEVHIESIDTLIG